MRPQRVGPPAQTGGPETEGAVETPLVSGSYGAPEGAGKDVGDLLDLGRDPFEVCGARWFTIALRLVQCERPAGHRGCCGPLREDDLEAALEYDDPEFDDRLERDDRAFDQAVWLS